MTTQDRRTAMALGMLASAQAAITAAVNLLAGAAIAEEPETVEATADPATCEHPDAARSEVAAMGNGEAQMWCLRCGTRLR